MATKNHQQKLSAENYIRQRSRNLPIYKCWVNSDWEKNKLADVLVSRKHKNGNITFCWYLVDLGCLGIKNTTFRFNVEEDYLERFVGRINDNHPIKEIPYTLAHNIILSAVEYAGELGFKQHQEFTQITEYFLEEDTEKIELINIECGENGKPIYIQGPNESDSKVNEIISQLEAVKGSGGYDYLILANVPEEAGSEPSDIDSIPFETKKNTFLQLMKNRSEGDSKERIEKIETLTNGLYMDLVSEETLLSFDKKWSAETKVEISYQPFTPEMLGLDEATTITVEDGKLLISIIANDENAQVAKEALQLKWGNFPFATHTEIQNLAENESANSMDRINDALIAYPGYALLLIDHYFHSPEEESKVPIDFEKIFAGRSAITELEMFHFQMARLIYFVNRKDLGALEAMYYKIDEMAALAKGYFELLRENIMMVRVSLLADLLSKIEDN